MSAYAQDEIYPTEHWLSAQTERERCVWLNISALSKQLMDGRQRSSIIHDVAFLPGKRKQLWLLKVARIYIVEENLLKLLKKIFFGGDKNQVIIFYWFICRCFLHFNIFNLMVVANNFRFEVIVSFGIIVYVICVCALFL